MLNQDKEILVQRRILLVRNKTRITKREFIQPTYNQKEQVLDEEEIKMLFYSKLIDQDIKYNDDQMRRFRRYIQKYSWNSKLRLFNLGLEM